MPGSEERLVARLIVDRLHRLPSECGHLTMNDIAILYLVDQDIPRLTL